MLTRIFFVLISFFLIGATVSAAGMAPAVTDTNMDTTLRDIQITDNGNDNTLLDSFMNPIKESFFKPTEYGRDGAIGMFTAIAYNIKNFFIAIAVIFLIIGVIKLLFSSSDEEKVKKWKANIIWTSVGIFLMQIAYSAWETLVFKDPADKIGSSFGWEFWVNIFSPIVSLLQVLAAFGFLLMAVWAFFMLVSAAGDEEKAKKAKNTILYAIIGFLLIKIPYEIVKSFYGRPGCEDSAGSFASVGACDIKIKEVDLDKGIGIIGKIFTFFNTFLSVICVILVVYAGFLIFISGGEEEKLKKAKSTILYIVIGFILLVASHAVFRFFILR